MAISQLGEGKGLQTACFAAGMIVRVIFCLGACPSQLMNWIAKTQPGVQRTLAIQRGGYKSRLSDCRLGCRYCTFEAPSVLSFFECLLVDLLICLQHVSAQLI
jgi:hypothetical protein